MEVFRLKYPSAPERVLSLLELAPEQWAGLKMGTVRLNKGEWVPLEGYSKHEQHELSVILSGGLEVECAGEQSMLQAGEVSLIPAGEEHRARATEDTELIWFWFGRVERVSEEDV
jgi:mannose-6-phosphate isomerase-like protein (cupin superfamily)